MTHINRRRFIVSASSLAALATPAVFAHEATPAASPVATPVAGGLQVRLIDMITIPNDLEVGGTLVGGISGLDYDPASGIWYFLSDDRSDYNPARFYTGNISYTDSGFENVSIDEVVTLLQNDGTEFPNSETGGNVPDPESIRKDPRATLLWWTSEGSYDLDIDPFVAISSPDGAMVAMYPMEAPFAMEYPEESGPRNNLVFEGLTFAADGQSVWIGLEGPLFQDGPAANLETGAVVRLINMDRSGAILREVALEIPAVAGLENSVDGSSGITELLALDDNRLLALLRASAIDADNNYTNLVQLLEVDLSAATDVRGVESLVDATFTPAATSVVIDFNTAGVEAVDNLETLTFGPDLPNGNRALIVGSDNNFNLETQISQFILLEVLG